jgi:pimeloyl-ACP methyl ester carboxylesterase
VDTIYRSARGRAEVQGWCADQLDCWPIQHRRDVVTAAGFKTHLVEAGQGPTVVVVSGDRFNAATNLPLLGVLSEHFRVIGVDVPGQPGLSANWADTEGGLGWYGRWFDDVVAQVGSCLAVGHSFGGAICLASQSPQLRGRLVVGTGGLCRLRLTPAVLTDFVLWSTVPGYRTSRRLLRRLLGGPKPRPREELVQWMTLVARHTRPVSSSEIAHPCGDTPTVVVTGEYDVFLPAARLAAAVRDVFGQDVIEIRGAGHLVTEQEPEKLRGLLHQVAGQDRST